MRTVTEEDATNALEETRANLLGPTGELQQPSNMRLISLKGVRDAVKASIANGKALPEDVMFLGGLTRVEQVFVYLNATILSSQALQSLGQSVPMALSSARSQASPLSIWTICSTHSRPLRPRARPESPSRSNLRKREVLGSLSCYRRIGSMPRKSTGNLSKPRCDKLSDLSK